MRKNALADYQPPQELTQATYLGYCGEYQEIEKELLEAQETTRSIRRRRKDYRATLSANGVNLDAFDRALKDIGRSGGERVAEGSAHRRFMLWHGKPIGFQASMDLQTDDAGLAALNTFELKKIDVAGHDAGINGASKDSNPWTPGTEAYQRWDTAWQRGHEEHVPGREAPKRRGRPPGSKSKSGPDLTVHEGGPLAAAAESDTRH